MVLRISTTLLKIVTGNGWLVIPKAFAQGLTDLTAKVMAKP